MKQIIICKSYLRTILCLLTFSLLSTSLMALSAQKQYMSRGNSLFKAKKYADAEVFYRKALECDTTNARVKYNLGNALLSQQKPKEAMQQYEKAVEYEKNPFFKAAIYHNMGVILQSQKQFGPAIECYKNSLRNYSIDDRTRYNLALCMHQLKNDQNSQQPQNNEQQQDENNKNQNKDQQKQQQKQEDEQQQQKDNSKMSKDNADQMLKAAMMQENRTQQKVREAMQNQRRRNLEKNW